MSVNEAEEPREMASLRNFGAGSRAASLPAPPARPRVSSAPELVADDGGVALPSRVPEPAAAASRDAVAPPPLPKDLLATLVDAPRTAVMASDPARRVAVRRQLGTYLGEDALRTLQYISYVEGCELWRLLDTTVRALAQARGVEVRSYTDQEVGKG